VNLNGAIPPATSEAPIMVLAPEAPGVPTVIPGDGQLTVTWGASTGAAEYEVYYGTTATPDILWATVSSTSTTITSLTNYASYYVSVRAKNSEGTSGFSPAASGMPYYSFLTPVSYRELIQVASSPVTITGSGSDGVFISGRTVTLSPYKMAKYETTYELWYEVKTWATSNGYTFANAGREGHDGTEGAAPTGSAKTEPVTDISWRDAIIWCNAYSEMSGKEPVYYTYASYTTVLRVSTSDSGTSTAADKAVMKSSADGYRLPTEEEWEHAARGGSQTNNTNWNYTFAGSNTADDVAWYTNNSTNSTHPVGGKAANAAWLSDMSGNVWEWCWDWYGPIAPGSYQLAAYRVVRGGSYGSSAAYCAVANRSNNFLSGSEPNYRNYNLGFRVVCP
jgi:formylglycine-generating enzyme required for sulfatase activity